MRRPSLASRRLAWSDLMRCTHATPSMAKGGTPITATIDAPTHIGILTLLGSGPGPHRRMAATTKPPANTTSQRKARPAQVTYASLSRKDGRLVGGRHTGSI